MDALGSVDQASRIRKPGPTFRPVPDETATPMPVQDLARWDTQQPRVA